MQKLFGYIGIQPTGDLAETASILGEALGGMVFTQDKRGSYDEFPAYIAEAFGLRYALLGVPDPEADVRDNPANHFTLHIEPMRPEAGEDANISDKVVATLKRDGRINCWILT